MTIKYRTDGPWGSGKGANLTPAEVDQNFQDHDGRIAALEGTGLTPDMISNITLAGSQLTFYSSGGGMWGPFTLPAAAFSWRGDWAPSTGYFLYDIVTVPYDGTYLVLANHTSDATAFDPGAGAFYRKIMAGLGRAAEFHAARVTRTTSLASTAIVAPDYKIAWEADNVDTAFDTDSLWSAAAPTDIIPPVGWTPVHAEYDLHLYLTGLTVGDTIELGIIASYDTPWQFTQTFYCGMTTGAFHLATGPYFRSQVSPVYARVVSLGAQPFTLGANSSFSVRFLD